MDDSNPLCHRVSVTLDIAVKDATVKLVAELSVFFEGVFLPQNLNWMGSMKALLL